MAATVGVSQREPWVRPTLRRVLRRIARVFFGRLAGRQQLQPAFALLHAVALEGMNIGAPADYVATSGEEGVLRALPRLVGPSERLVIIDGGANKGDYAAAALAACGVSAQIHCFEPSGETFALLAHRFGATSNVTLHPVGLGREESHVPLYTDAPGSGMNSVLPRQLEYRGQFMRETETVRLRRLDDICREQGLDHIHLLKLDVEGSELAVLAGASSLLDRGAIDVIQFEFGAAQIDNRSFLKDFVVLLTPRYRLYRIVRDGVVPLDRYKETYEIFTTTNYLAVTRRLPTIGKF